MSTLLSAANNIFYTTLFSIAVLLIIVLYVAFFCKGLRFAEKNGSKFLFGTCILIFLFQIIANSLPGDDPSYEQIKLIITFIFNVGPICCSFYMCNKYWKLMEADIDSGKVGDSVYPTQMVAQGTFYTFVGVSAILMSYHANGYSDINLLISGLKLAFITSVIGLIYSVAAKNYLKRETEKYETDHSIKNDYLTEQQFYDLLVSMKDKNAELAERSNTILVDWKKEMCDSFASEMRNLSGVFSDNLNKSNNELINKLNLISNTAVANITKTFGTIQTQTEAISKSLSNVEKDSKNIAIHMNEFKQHVETFNQATGQLCVGFDVTADKIIEASNKFESNINNGNNTIVASTEATIQSINSLKQAFEAAIADVTGFSLDAKFEPLNNAVDEYNKILAKLAFLIDNMQTKHQENLEKVNTQMNDFVTALNTKNIETAEKICAAFSTFNSSIAEYKLVVEQSTRDIVDQDKSIKIAGQKIVDEYSEIKNQIVRKHSEFDTQLIEAQNNFNKELNNTLSQTINVVTDVIRQAYDEYTTRLAKIETDIEKLKENAGDDEE